MEYKLMGISVLILIILVLTWIKDGEKMDPPLKKRMVIDITAIADVCKQKLRETVG